MTGEKDDDEPKRFADLIGKTRPLAPSPERLDPSVRRAAIPDPHESRSRIGPFRWPDPEERLRAAAHGVSDARLQALARGDPEPEERIDLHGLRREMAARRLADRIASARQRGLRCVIVVHGRGERSASGEAVLRDALPDWLSTGRIANDVLAFAPAPNQLGGEGATLILLRHN